MSVPPVEFPGEYRLADGDVVGNAGRPTVELVVANTGDRPIQVGSHFHFFEANKALRFDRAPRLRHAARHPRGHGGALRAGRREDA